MPQQTLNRPKKVELGKKQSDIKLTMNFGTQPKPFGVTEKGGLTKKKTEQLPSVNTSFFKMPKLKTSVFSKQTASPANNRVSKIKLRPTPNPDSSNTLNYNIESPRSKG